MSPVRYDYEQGRGGSGGSRGRAIVIFLIALAVIGCGIYFFTLPHGMPTSQPETPTVPASGDAAKTESQTKDPANSPDVTGKPAGETPPASPAPDTPGEAPSAAPDADNPQSPEQQETGAESSGNAGGGDVPANTTDLSGNGGKSAPPPAETPTEDPQKGKPWIGDPASEQPTSGGTAAPPPQVVDPLGSAVTVAVRAGDSLSRLALRHHTTVEALRHYNKLHKDVIRIGQKLRVVPGPWKITVDKGQRTLTLERRVGDNWSEFARFSVGLGRLNSTPDAEFVISTRLRHPDWYMPDGRIYRYGDPENQLGDYFLKLAMTGAPDKPLLGYGIHGTPDEKSVGKNWSNGCVRMRNRDVEILYYLVPSGTPVTIVPGADEPRKPEK